MCSGRHHKAVSLPTHEQGMTVHPPTAFAGNEDFLRDGHDIVTSSVSVSGLWLWFEISGGVLLNLCIVIAMSFCWHPRLGVRYCIYVVHCVFPSYHIWPVPVDGTIHVLLLNSPQLKCCSQGLVRLLALNCVTIIWLCVCVAPTWYSVLCLPMPRHRYCQFTIFCPRHTVT